MDRLILTRAKTKASAYSLLSNFARHTSRSSTLTRTSRIDRSVYIQNVLDTGSADKPRARSSTACDKKNLQGTHVGESIAPLTRGSISSHTTFSLSLDTPMTRSG